MAAQGHEIACHSDQHENVYTLARADFPEQCASSEGRHESAREQPVVGFQESAEFFHRRRTAWAYPVLAEAGFSYDSSLVTDRPRARPPTTSSMYQAGIC